LCEAKLSRSKTHDAVQSSQRGGRTRCPWMSVRGQARSSHGWCTRAHDDVQRHTIIKVPFANSAGTGPFRSWSEDGVRVL
jgi:hypothetical protein